MHRRGVLAALGAGGIAGLAGCGAVLGADDRPCAGADCAVGMTRNAYVPATYIASVGETVVWRNTSGAEHTVTAYDSGVPDGATYFASGGYDSEDSAREAWFGERGGGIAPRDTFEHTFETAGTYRYVCIPHERSGMVGEIVVEG